MSNAERQRQFVARNPDYYRLRYHKRKAEMAALVAVMNARAAETLALPAMPVRLALPAPVEVLPLFAPALRERELVPVFAEINTFDAIPARAYDEPRP